MLRNLHIKSINLSKFIKFLFRCGTDSVVLYWDKLVLMVGPFGDWIKYSYDDAIYLVPEIDGVRIISSDKCEFLQKVPSMFFFQFFFFFFLKKKIHYN